MLFVFNAFSLLFFKDVKVVNEVDVREIEILNLALSIRRYSLLTGRFQWFLTIAFLYLTHQIIPDIALPRSLWERPFPAASIVIEVSDSHLLRLPLAFTQEVTQLESLYAILFRETVFLLCLIMTFYFTCILHLPLRLVQALVRMTTAQLLCKHPIVFLNLWWALTLLSCWKIPFSREYEDFLGWLGIYVLFRMCGRLKCLFKHWCFIHYLAEYLATHFPEARILILNLIMSGRFSTLYVTLKG